MPLHENPIPTPVSGFIEDCVPFVIPFTYHYDATLLT